MFRKSRHNLILKNFISPDEIKTTKKQCEVLSKTAVEDKDIEIERKLEDLRQDFEARLLSKNSENTQNISIVTKKFCSQIEENRQIHEVKLEYSTHTECERN